MEFNQERRLNDIDWRGHIDRRLNEQDEALHGIKHTLDGHIKTTAELRAKVEPVADAMDNMQAGIKVIGWIGSKFARVSVTLAAIFGGYAAWRGLK